jgi:aspartate-semialdehyde dehydrogenase
MAETRPLRIAILGAQDPLGEAVMALLAERDVDVGELIPLSLDECDAAVEFAGNELAIAPAENFDWRAADVMVAATHHPAARRYIESAANQGCAAICLLSGLDAHAGGVIRVPSGLALAAATALKPIVRQAGLQSVDVFASLPVSLAGKSGVEELAAQTQAVFNLTEADPEVFPVRIAFNMIPQVGKPMDNGDIDSEALSAADLCAHLGLPELQVMVTATWAPMFYGAALAIHGTTAQDCSRAELRDWLSQAAGVTVMDEALLGGAPTPFTEAQENESVFVGRLRTESAGGRRFALWLVCDAIRLEAARIVDQIENLIEKKAI